MPVPATPIIRNSANRIPSGKSRHLTVAALFLCRFPAYVTCRGRPDKAQPPSGIISAAQLPDGALHAYPAYQTVPTATPILLLPKISQRGVVSPLKSANRSVNDKVWTPWMADRGEPRQDVESSRPQSGTWEVSAVRSTDFLAGPRGLIRGARPLPLSRSPHKR